MAPALATVAAPTRSGERRLLYARATLWLLFLGPFFFLTYGMAAYWTSTLPYVPSVAFAWEKEIPFIEWTIVPYMSIDVFYVASLFLCKSRVELDTHCKRLLWVTLASVLCFLLFPLRFDTERPPTTGVCGALFTLLSSVDPPYNQAPSLHVSLLLLLWLVYARHLNGWAKWAMHFWFTLIGVSVLTTFQHRFVDCIGGIVVGVACVYAFPAQTYVSRAERPLDPMRVRLACLYGGAASGLVAAATLAEGWAWTLMWPAVSLALVALAYARLDTAVFQKNGGDTAWAARILLLPYRTGAWFSSRSLTRGASPGAQVVPGLWIGRAPGRGDLERIPVRAILDLTAEFAPTPKACRMYYLNVPMLDLVAPPLADLEEAVRELDKLYATGPVLVHCALGYARSALVVAAWVYKRGFATSRTDAILLVKTARPRIVLSQAALSVLDRYISQCEVSLPVAS